jgi:hypothetical protein
MAHCMDLTKAKWLSSGDALLGMHRGLQAHMQKLGFVSMFTLVAAFATTAPGCSDAENAYNCDQICDRYKDCFDANYDADACQSRCESKADDASFADKAESCETCIDDKSCTGAFSCADDCVGIVP